MSGNIEQDDYCEACRCNHIEMTHDQRVSNQCRVVNLQGFNVVLECRRMTGHDGYHRDLQGRQWVGGAE